MKNIKIYSLSTVGIRQHFHQDYLFHEDRTDFTGSNGSGKSIIADLLQIIFVANKKYIKFGTESLDKDKRELHTLPYKQNEAYSFLNIRIEEYGYITVGVCISSKAGVPIKPFVITNSTNLDLKIEENSFSTPLIFTDFLNESGRVQNLQGVAKQLNKNKSLKLTHFIHAENLDKYYTFLYQKEVLPINLSIEENLKSFSTVIQSFSRASNLRLKNSKDLKEFLFESEKENLMGEYKRYRADLLTLMNDFRNLKEKIDSIDGKQRALIALKGKHDLFQKINLEHSQMEVLFHRNNFLVAEKNKKEIETKLKKLKSQKSIHDEEIERLDLLQQDFDKKKELNEEKVELLTELIDIENLLKPILEQIKFWKEVDFPTISDEDQKLLSEFKVKENYYLSDLKAIYKSSTPLYNFYGSFEKVNEERSKQRETLEKLKNILTEENDQKERLLQILNQANEDGLLNTVLKSGKELSEEQEVVLMNLIELGFKQPDEPKNGTRYINDNSILSEKFITNEEDNNGVWLNLGRLSEFHEKRDKRRIFADPKTFGKKINELKAQLREELKSNHEKLAELHKIQNGESYKKVLFKEEFDLRLTDNSQINQLKTAMFLYLEKEEQISALKENNAEKIESKNSLIEKLKLREDESKNELLCKVRTKQKALDTEWKKNNDLLSGTKTKSAVVITDIINLSSQFQQSEKTYIDLEKEFDRVKEDFSSNFPETDLAFVETERFNKKRYEELVGEISEAKKGYQNEYIRVVSEFEETKNKADVNINLHIQSNTFDFSALESTLLGPKIKYLDNIKPEMDEMNRNRLDFVNDLYEKMIKIFSSTEDQYKAFETKVKDLNGFFKDKKISEQYYFSIEFSTEKCLDINWIYSLREKSSEVFMKGEIPFGESADDFIEKFFQKISNHRQKVNLSDLLDPKNYFQLSTKMEDENGEENSGSTGETYTALVLLGIARLSLVQKEERNGLRFVILEESSNLDDTNFNLFPKIAKDYHYQIITMTPKPFGSDSTEGWYLHQLIKGKKNKDVNYPVPVSYFKTKNARQKLSAYIKEQVG